HAGPRVLFSSTPASAPTSRRMPLGSRTADRADAVPDEVANASAPAFFFFFHFAQRARTARRAPSRRCAAAARAAAPPVRARLRLRGAGIAGAATGAA